MKVAVIGGGAAGYFAAIHASGPGIEVTIFEKTPKLLSKVKVSGGGRCNVTHRPMEISKLVKNYPRGEKFLKRTFRHFSIPDTFDWFQSRGVELKVESDGRVFPVSDSSQSIIDCLQREAEKAKVHIRTSTAIRELNPLEKGYELITEKGVFRADAVVIAAGGQPKSDGYFFLKSLKHSVKDPIPSLFTFNTPGEPIRELMGIAVPDGMVKIEGTKLSYRGPVLVTHWGISGPAVLKLSAFGADWLHQQQYRARVLINWNAGFGENDYLEHLTGYAKAHPNRKVHSHPLFELPARLWEHFCEKAEIEEGALLGNLSKKNLNKLVQNLFCYILAVSGKTTFKEEFVTAGGISLTEVDPETMQSIYHPNLYFAGEVLDIDGITGGFNFQAAWSTGFLAGKSIKQRIV
ncbi:NAD(P)/FAD-dependent oxidoreductase [Algoriphagus sp. H41]|uniref:NAD(P)/FAD-dependent oxidoreductase n=1 Tax=Algoriphagus oliviformis TaxID=2811231 RepID=A0ABS3C143_9BACT|nr:NAD(P)/FAD-dependent oxidoreductase [Algoriphagus oliviformis]MBN7810823.1 NAD(P)/FAD-dependent oxidoreductase [Algoriphagus oliviformis]